MTTLASFDAGTQAKAQAVFDLFTSVYKIAGNMIRAEELGAAVQAGLDAAGGDAGAEAFGDAMRERLLGSLHQRMVEFARKGEKVPSELDAASYAQLESTLTQKFGALPPAG